MFRDIQIAVDPDAKGSEAEIEAQVRLAFAAPDLFAALYLCRRALLRSAPHEKQSIEVARDAIIAATGEEP